jgi:hypothetical protein
MIKWSLVPKSHAIELFALNWPKTTIAQSSNPTIQKQSIQKLFLTKYYTDEIAVCSRILFIECSLAVTIL